MKKIFLLFALLSCVSFSNAFAVVASDPCDTVMEGYARPEVLCTECIGVYDAIIGNRLDMGYTEDMCSELQQLVWWQEFIGRVKEYLIYDVQAASCLQEVVYVFDDLHNSACATNMTGAAFCISKGFCECSPNYYADMPIYDELHNGQGFNCLECPEPGVGAGGVLPITQCYLPAGSGESDTTGTWQYSQNCYYSE